MELVYHLAAVNQFARIEALSVTVSLSANEGPHRCGQIRRQLARVVQFM